MAEEEDNDDLPTAISNHVMKEGRHYCTIKVTDNKEACITAGICRSMENFDPEFAFEHERKRQKEIQRMFPMVGADVDRFALCGETMSPIYNVSTYAQWDSNCHACAYNAASGKAMWVGWDSEKDDPNDQLKDIEITEWEGMETLPPGSVLGLLLDLDEGTLTVYKDNRRLGVMKDGLEGSFCWFVETFHPCEVEINREPVPSGKSSKTSSQKMASRPFNQHLALAEALNTLADYNHDDDYDEENESDDKDEEDKSPLQFDTIFSPRECKYLYDDQKHIIYCMAEEEDNDDLPTAISNHVMKEGRHYCTIKVTDNKEACITAGICRSMENFDPEFAFEHERKRQKEIQRMFPMVGADVDRFALCGETMSPIYNVSTYAQWDSNCHACAYNAASGKAMWVGWDSEKDDPNDQLKDIEITEWEGMETLPPGSVLGLLLDLDEGTLTVYKDNRRLGVMKDGLEGSFCWFVETFHPCEVEINREPVPVPPVSRK